MNSLPAWNSFGQPGPAASSPLPTATPSPLPDSQVPTSFTNRQEELRRRLAARTNAIGANPSTVIAGGTNTFGNRTFNRSTNRTAVTGQPTALPGAAPAFPTPGVPAFPNPSAVVTTPNTTVVTPAPGTAVIVNPNPVSSATNALRNVITTPGSPGTVGLPSVGMNPPITLAQPPGSPTVITNEDISIANLPVSTNPVNPAVNADERYEPGDLQIQEMPLPQFFELYSLYSGRTILRASALPAPNLNLRAQTPLTRREVVEAMDAVLALNLITMIPIGDKFVKAVPSAQAMQEGAPLSEVPGEQLPVTEQFITRLVKLKVAKAAEVAPILQTFAKTPNGVTAIESNNTLVLRDYSSNIKRMLEIIETLDVTVETDFTLEVIPIKYGKVGDIYSTMSALISGGGGGGAVGGTTAGGFGRGGMGSSFGGGGMGRSNMRGGGMNSFGGGGGYGGGGYGGNSYGGNNRYGGGGGYYPQEADLNRLTEMTPQQVAQPSVGGAQSSFQNRLNNIVNRAATPPELRILEGANIVPDERSNKLLIFANKKDMVMITNIVSKVDTLLAQVLIEAVILEVNIRDSMTLGVSAAQSPKRFGQDFSGAGNVNNGQTLLGNLTNFPSATPEGFNYFGHIGNDFDVAINAVARDSKFNVVSKPRIQTSHAIPGFFFIGRTVPYVTGTTDYGLVGSGLTSRSTVQERTIGLNLGVTPFITPEGMVVMEIEQSFENQEGNVTIDGNPIPLVNSRQASAVLTVRNGDLIMLGGFISENKGSTKSGVPFLKDIPGLGALFRTKNDSNDRTELIILMKATVLETPEAAAFLANTERSMLPGVYQAEKEFQESEAKRLKKAKKK
ncbi:MAG: secretin N-terminal domain-containing protein [Verrucomicrobiales bacterium]